MNDFKVVCCVSCRSGYEQRFAQLASGDDVTVIVPLRIRREKDRGKWIENRIKLLPGYAFIYADSMEAIHDAQRGFKVHMLSYSDGETALHGADLQFARWAWENHGVIGVSAAIHEQDRIKIVDGPLKNMEGMIIKLDRRHMLANVETDMGLRTWLSYDWLDNIIGN